MVRLRQVCTGTARYTLGGIQGLQRRPVTWFSKDIPNKKWFKGPPGSGLFGNFLMGWYYVYTYIYIFMYLYINNNHTYDIYIYVNVLIEND